jgi:hypothetical protein
MNLMLTREQAERNFKRTSAAWSGIVLAFAPDEAVVRERSDRANVLVLPARAQWLVSRPPADGRPAQPRCSAKRRQRELIVELLLLPGGRTV